MTSDTNGIARRAQEIYDRQLKDRLEKSSLGSFVAIEPVSGDHFLGGTLSEAIGRARKAYPDRLVHTLRVGHKATVHLGAFAASQP